MWINWKGEFEQVFHCVINIEKKEMDYVHITLSHGGKF